MMEKLRGVLDLMTSIYNPITIKIYKYRYMP